ncbi:hypothetical protein FGO68_gene4906 [Halteria grandinella]|uniref:Uncharacterized protein n=1 Tax=Halteria grandinella TaxID=5974 RepID=A0A8J8NA79_HALGN|nr:hypothetical protein FGO68_gene4906 [Halteria grandinella]
MQCLAIQAITMIEDLLGTNRARVDHQRVARLVQGSLMIKMGGILGLVQSRHLTRRAENTMIRTCKISSMLGAARKRRFENSNISQQLQNSQICSNNQLPTPFSLYIVCELYSIPLWLFNFSQRDCACFDDGLEAGHHEVGLLLQVLCVYLSLRHPSQQHESDTAPDVCPANAVWPIHHLLLSVKLHCLV